VTTDDTTFAAATISWTAADPDGDIAKASYRVWLDGNEANPVETTATTLTIPTDAFLQGGQLLSGKRKVFVQAIDEGGFAAQPESLQWFVRAPAAVTVNNRARLLIIDDVPADTRENFRQDTLYVNTAVRNLPAGTFSILRLNFSQPFHSTADLEQTFKLFDVVLWYRGTETTVPAAAHGLPGGRRPLSRAGREVLHRNTKPGRGAQFARHLPGVVGEPIHGKRLAAHAQHSGDRGRPVGVVGYQRIRLAEQPDRHPQPEVRRRHDADADLR
jgi:hypothetical protein